MLKEKRLVILDCCRTRFSKVIGDWLFEPFAGEDVLLEIFPGQSWRVDVSLILPKKSESNPYGFDVVFTKSEEECLFDCLCSCLGNNEGWFQDEEAIKLLLTY